MREGARKWKGPRHCQTWSDIDRSRGVQLTTAGRVVPGHLAKVGMVLDCFQMSVNWFVLMLSSILRSGSSSPPRRPSSNAQFQSSNCSARREFPCHIDEEEGCDVRLARKNSPEMLRASQRTTTICWPLRSCLATMLARRPSRWPLPSITTC